MDESWLRERERERERDEREKRREFGVNEME